MTNALPDQITDKPRRFLSTAIPYVNAAPHIGFALELVQADCLARFYRQRGEWVFFQGGTDENSIKNVQAADAASLPVEKLVEQNAQRFLALAEKLNISNNSFVRTSASAQHRIGVERLWKSCCEAGDIYKRAYSGLYCVGCEQFYKPGDLADGRCPEHGTEPESVVEENWFFRLSRYQDRLSDLLNNGTMQIVPAARANEVRAWISGGLEDFSISRSAARARGWGIPVPDDPDQVIYVWFDALGNYITGLGYGGPSAENLSAYWADSAAREHVIGKGISRFHALYWPAILMSAGLNVPSRIFVHGYVTVEGRKIGKSAGNAIDPVPLANQMGADALRYYLLRHIRASEDGDFSQSRFQQAYTAELGGQLGNLVHRTLKMIEAYRGGLLSCPSDFSLTEDRLKRSVDRLATVVANHLEDFAFDRALEAVWLVIAEANRYVAEEEPWALAKAGEAHKLDLCLFSLFHALRVVAYCIYPMLPETSEKLATKLGLPINVTDPIEPVASVRVAAGLPLFPAVASD
ncbi:methionyl-tRNA synthetase [Rhizobium sp. BK650]|uniref:methionine--tRNA ligase n=1 Tax=Rhizobium sp. BK650 TaxID=2586990 RepID=UPI00160F8705|nr:methionine--tRNA ligase [Rhizobium sp. BK650]MBB3660985.1 methionyl-tRNA synthetase [Rhizobium sp. BK650]